MYTIHFLHISNLIVVHVLQRSYQDPESHIYEQVVCGPWELNKYNLVLTNEKLGTGQFGMVKKGYFKKDREHRLPVAVKSLRGELVLKNHDAVLFYVFIKYLYWINLVSYCSI